MKQAHRPGIRPPTFSRRQIIGKADALIRRHFDLVGLNAARLGMRFESIYENVIYPEYEIDLELGENLGDDESGSKILGKFLPHENLVLIDASLGPNDPRRTFTLWHEVGGHAILQGEWLRSELRRVQTEIQTTEADLSHSVESRLEWQANFYAGQAAAPTWLIVYAIRSIFELNRPYRYIGPQKYWFPFPDGARTLHCRSFNEVCRRIACCIQRLFGNLSVEALSYRVEESPFVIDETCGQVKLELRRTANAHPQIHRRPVRQNSGQRDRTLAVAGSH